METRIDTGRSRDEKEKAVGGYAVLPPKEPPPTLSEMGLMKKKALRQLTPRETNLLKMIVKECGGGPVQMMVRQIVIELSQDGNIEGF